MNLNDIYNNNLKNTTNDENYKSFNDFIFSNDTKILGKLLHRFDFFLKVKDLPGDIVELGVFKGSGIATFSKFVDIYCPNSNKKIIGFDIFSVDESDIILNKDSKLDKDKMLDVYSRINTNELTLENVTKRLDNMNINKKYFLIKGDIEETLPKFIDENPGMRASLIYFDLDLERPTYCGLKYLWDRLLPGGIIVFDEYEYHKFSESNGVDKFLKEKNLLYEIKSTNWIAPTAFLIKK